jgi:hypothetical protein
MSRLKKILILDNIMEAIIMEDKLREKKIPFVIQTYHDEAYDGIFTLHKGWGYIEADAKYQEEIISIYKIIVYNKLKG